MKIFLSLFFLSLFAFSTSVDSKIKQNKKQLSSKKVQYKKMDKQLSTIAKKITIAKQEQIKLDNELTSLALNIKNNEVEFKSLQILEVKYRSNLNSFTRNINNKQKKFVDLISTSFSLALALEELNQPTPDSIMMKEVYKLYEEKNNVSIKKLTKEIEVLKRKKSSLKVKKNNIQTLIEGYSSERKVFQSQKTRQNQIVKDLARDKAIYKKRFYKIKASRKSLERKLVKLKIVKRSNDKAQKIKEKEKIFAKSATKRTTEGAKQTSSLIAKYKGGKVTSPLRGARLIKRFGTYIDPVYKFKIFNKSITLKAPHAGSKVRSVLAGKIVFAENSGGMLGKVVIVKHANKMHTIYAKLSRLAPGIHVGKQLLQGTIIGKVDKSLMFEVTRNNKHVNPLTLIKL